MKFYIATRLENAEAHRQVARILTAAGWELTYDLTAHGSVQREGEARIAEVDAAKAAGSTAADVVIVLLPGGRGTHCELGMAIALCKSIFILADPESGFFAQDERTCAFYHSSNVHRVEGGILDLLEAALRHSGWTADQRRR